MLRPTLLLLSLAASSAAMTSSCLRAAQDTEASAPDAQTLVRGRVLGPLGEPVADAEVYSLSPGDERARGLVRSDARGRYTMRDVVVRGPTQIVARAEGHSLASAWIYPSSGRRIVRDFRLWAAATIRGVLVDGQGRAVQGASLTASFDLARGFGFDPRASDESDEEGRFTLPHVPLGHIHVRAWAPGYAMARASLDLAGDTELDLVLRRGEARTLSLRVVDEDGKGLPACTVRVLPYANGSHQVLPAPLRRGTTDARGDWSITGYPEDLALRVSVSLAGRAMKPSTIRVAAVPAAAPAAVGGIVQLGRRRDNERASSEGLRFVAHVAGPASIRLRGRVVDQDGRGVAGQRLECRRPNRRGGGLASTDDEGKFTIDCPEAPGETIGLYLLGSKYAVEVQDEQGGRLRQIRSYYRTRVEPERQYVIPVVLGSVIVGRVVSEAGLPARNHRIEIQDYSASRMPQWFPRRYGRTDARGEFRVSGLHPALGHVRVHCSGALGEAASEGFKLEAGKVHDGFQLVLPSPGKVVGRVVDGAGKPIGGARVQLYTHDPETGQQRDGSVLEVLSDARGRFAHLEVARGHYTVHALVGANARLVGVGRRAFEVKSGKTTDLEDLGR